MGSNNSRMMDSINAVRLSLAASCLTLPWMRGFDHDQQLHVAIARQTINSNHSICYDTYIGMYHPKTLLNSKFMHMNGGTKRDSRTTYIYLKYTFVYRVDIVMCR